MLEGIDLRDPILINSIGHTAGVLLFGLIIVLLLRDSRTHGISQTRLSLVAAVLAFGWNIGSLIAIATGEDSAAFIGLVMTLSFSVLSFLPAVLLHVALRGKQQSLVAAGYLVSSLAAVLHFGELLYPRLGLNQFALVLIACGFGLLTVASFLTAQRRRESGKSNAFPEWVSLTCLLLFTGSFLHFGYQHVSSPWASEVTWHHIGIPVVLIVLLQDYRFLLLDTFARFLMNLGLAALYISGLLALNHRFHLWDLMHRDTFIAGLSLVLLCVSLILFVYLRNALQAWMSRVIFRRRSIDDCAKTISTLSTPARSEEELLALSAQEVAGHFRTEHFLLLAEVSDHKPLDSPSLLLLDQPMETSRSGNFSAEAQIPLRFSSGDSRFLLLGARHGGRRYLSEDFDDMRRLAAVIVEQVERFRGEELKRLVAQAELRALQAQINPHFLFNALNTLYGTIDRRSQEARRLVLNLADIFRYVLQGDRTTIPLSEELRIVEAYLEIESLRLGGRLTTELLVGESARSTLIPILSIQPLVENAVKHGIAEKSGGGRVSLHAEKTPSGLRVTVADTGIGFDRSNGKLRGGAGVGLENVRRRLALCHGPEADLHIESSSAGTTVSFFLPDAAALPIPSSVLQTEIR